MLQPANREGGEEAWQGRAVFAGREKERVGKALGSPKKEREGVALCRYGRRGASCAGRVRECLKC